MSRAALVLHTEAIRQRAHHWIASAPRDTRVTFQAPKRTLPQNAKLWAALTDVASQTTHHGIKLTTDDWKILFLDALKREVRMVPNLDGNGIVSLGRSSSDLSKEEMGDLLEIIAEFGARNGIVFHDSEEDA